jgi:hypothetical protein
MGWFTCFGRASCPRQGTTQKGTGATGNLATRTRHQWDLFSPHNLQGSSNQLGGSGEPASWRPVVGLLVGH